MQSHFMGGYILKRERQRDRKSARRAFLYLVRMQRWGDDEREEESKFLFLSSLPLITKMKNPSQSGRPWHLVNRVDVCIDDE